ncbi:MAG: DUF5655 domain-containing protein [Candidatus Woykebacteria bacterium]
MQIFKLKGSDLSPLSEKKFNLEKDIQSLTEKNLETIFGYEFVSTEFNVNNFWIDTLAFDPESRSFIIIEYKRDQGMSVVDQGYAYLAAMLNNKAEFILEYNEKLKKSLNRNDVDWSQSKVIFISRHFTTHQKGAIEFKDLPIELWEVKKFEEDLLVFNQLKPAEIKDSIKTVSKSKTVRDVSEEVKSYTLDDHLAKIDQNSKEIFLNLYNQLLEIGDGITENVTRYYIGFRFHGTNFTSISYRNGTVILNFRTKVKPSTQLKIEKLPETAWDTTPLWKTTIKSTSEIPAALEIAKHAYKDYESRFK